MTLRSSTIIPRDGETKSVRFWNRYKLEADEYDAEFLKRFRDDLNGTMILSALFTAVEASVASMSLSDLGPDPNLKMETLLQNLVLLSMRNSSDPLPMLINLPEWNGPDAIVILVQFLLYASLACSLSVALGTVLGLQWLSRYESVGERGSMEDRCRERQRKLNGLEEWHFRTILEVLPVLLQISLLLFGLALSAYMWDKQRVVGAVLISVHGLAALLYVMAIAVSVLYSDCPFTTPLSDRIRDFSAYTAGIYRSLLRRLAWSGVHRYATSLIRQISNVFMSISTIFMSMFHWIHHSQGQSIGPHRDLEASTLPPHLPTTPFYRVSSWAQKVIAPMFNARRAIRRRFGTRHRVIRNADLDRVAILWLLKTSTNTDVRVDALVVASDLKWEDATVPEFLRLGVALELELILNRLAVGFKPDPHPGSFPSIPRMNKDRALAYGSTFLFVYWEWRILDPDAATTWIGAFGPRFMQSNPSLMKTLQEDELARVFILPQEREVLHLLYLTLAIDSDVCEEKPKAAEILRCEAVADVESLCNRTLFYLAQVAQQGTSASRHQLLLVVARRYHHAATSELAHSVAFLTFSILCGYRHDRMDNLQRIALDSIDRDVLVKKIPGLMEHFLRRLYSGRDRSCILALQTIIRLIHTHTADFGFMREPWFSEQCLRVAKNHIPHVFLLQSPSILVGFIAGLLRLTILCACHKQDTSLPSFSHELRLGWITEEELYSSPLWRFLDYLRIKETQLTMTESADSIHHAAADIFLLLSTINTPPDLELLVFLSEWLERIKTSEQLSQNWTRTWSEHPLFRTQSAILCYVFSLPAQLRSKPEFLSILDSPLAENPDARFCSLVSLPHTEQLFGATGVNSVATRDTLFIQILSGQPDLDELEAAVLYVRQWAAVIHRWMPSSPTKPFPVGLLSRCRTLTSLSDTIWDATGKETRLSAQCIWILVLWLKQFSLVPFRDDISPWHDMDLVATKQRILSFDPSDVAPVADYIHDLAYNFTDGDISTQLRDVRSSLISKLSERRGFQVEVAWRSEEEKQEMERWKAQLAVQLQQEVQRLQEGMQQLRQLDIQNKPQRGKRKTRAPEHSWKAVQNKQT
ncbi:hypothetical protein BXZ70DRAFT_554556 [Cristinia sonorae]|uniref:DUF6535 domain-containing protein n=1 Tax=Cristinia sonorae TaxID=1940300 RepID=A0A8K0UFK2_9AGAR|nr:hypothetical protein BXZ70DRAFT_554556 [Cristinia sonorae]